MLLLQKFVLNDVFSKSLLAFQIIYVAMKAKLCGKSMCHELREAISPQTTNPFPVCIFLYIKSKIQINELLSYRCFGICIRGKKMEEEIKIFMITFS